MGQKSKVFGQGQFIFLFSGRRIIQKFPTKRGGGGGDSAREMYQVPMNYSINVNKAPNTLC
jgi:hypothetical protein